MSGFGGGRGGGGRVKKVMTQPISLIFRFLQNVSAHERRLLSGIHLSRTKLMNRVGQRRRCCPVRRLRLVLHYNLCTAQHIHHLEPLTICPWCDRRLVADVSAFSPCVRRFWLAPVVGVAIDIDGSSAVKDQTSRVADTRL